MHAMLEVSVWGDQELVVAGCKVHQEQRRGDGHGKTEGIHMVDELVSVLGSKQGR